MKKIDWFIYKRGSVPIHVFEAALIGFTKYYKKFFNLEFSNILFYSNKKMAYWCWGINMMHEFAYKYSGEIKLKTQNKYKEKWIKLASNLYEISINVINTNLDRFSNLEKFEFYQKLNTPFEKFHAYSATSIDFMDEFLPAIIEKEFKKIPSEFQNPENYSILINQAEPSVILQKEIDFLKLKIGKIGLEEFYNKYFWINCGWSEQPIYTIKEIKADLDKIELTPTEIKQKIKNILNNIKNAKSQKSRLLKKINDNGFANLIDFADCMVFYHDDRKRYQMISVIAMNKILRSIKDYNYADILWCKSKEVLNYLKNGKPIDIDKIRKRKMGSLLIADSKKVSYLFSPKAKEKAEKIIYNEEIDQTADEIKGTVAYPGLVRGKVKIILDPRGIHDKITADDILVTGMTTPDFVPIMKRVSAIITDEGGLTCHSAIIARELGIPCIIGTKIATKVLRDGDLVEVNANQGIIKKLR